MPSMLPYGVTTREVLEAAKARIDKPQKWCRGISRNHRRVCAINAFDTSVLDRRDFNHAISALQSALDGRSIVEFNDTHTHAEVMALFDRAIEAAS